MLLTNMYEQVDKVISTMDNHMGKIANQSHFRHVSYVTVDLQFDSWSQQIVKYALTSQISVKLSLNINFPVTINWFLTRIKI